MLQVQAQHLAESYMNDANYHSYIRRLLALPFLPAEHIPPMMTRRPTDGVYSTEQYGQTTT